jgi:hypothetical protein
LQEAPFRPTISHQSAKWVSSISRRRYVRSAAGHFAAGTFTSKGLPGANMERNRGLTFVIVAGMCFAMLSVSHIDTLSGSLFGLPSYVVENLTRLTLACVVGLGVTAILYGLKG